MKRPFNHQAIPCFVPAKDGKRIDEHFGRVATGAGATVCYSNPWNEPAVSRSVCTAAFAPELAHRCDAIP